MGYVSALLWWSMSVNLTMPLVGYVGQLKAGVLISLVGYVIGSGGGDVVDGSGGGDLGGGSLGGVIGKVMKRDGGLVEAMGGCRPPTPAPAGWVRPW